MDQKSEFGAKEMRSEMRPPRIDNKERRDYPREPPPRDLRDARDSRDSRDTRDGYRDQGRFDGGRDTPTRGEAPSFRPDRATSGARKEREQLPRNDFRADHRQDGPPSRMEQDELLVRHASTAGPREGGDVRDFRERRGPPPPELPMPPFPMPPPQFRHRPPNFPPPPPFDRELRNSHGRPTNGNGGDNFDFEPPRRNVGPLSSSDGPRDMPRDRFDGPRDVPRDRDLVRDRSDGSRDVPRDRSEGPRDLPRDRSEGPRDRPEVSRDAPRERDSSSGSSRDFRDGGLREPRGDSVRDIRRSEPGEPRREAGRDPRDARDFRDAAPRDPPRDSNLEPRDGLNDSREHRDGPNREGERRRPDFVPRDMHRMMRSDPSGGRPPLEHRQHHRPSILGSQQPNYHPHQRPSITAPMRQFDPTMRRMESYGRSGGLPMSSTSGDLRGPPKHNKRATSPSRNNTSATSDISSAAPSDASTSAMDVSSSEAPPPTSTTPEPGSALNPSQTDPTSVALPAIPLPSKTEILLGIEDKEDSIVEISKEVERLRKEREQLAKEVQSFENTKNRGKLLHLVPGLPIRPEILTTGAPDLIRETYEHNLRLSNRASDTVDAQLWDSSGRPKLAPFLNFITSTSKHFKYLAATSGSTSELVSGAVSSSATPPPLENGVTASDSQTQASAHTTNASSGGAAGGVEDHKMQVDASSSATNLVMDPDYLPTEEGKDLSPPEIDETTFFEPIEVPDVSDYSFYSDNMVLHAQLRDLMIASVQEKRAEKVAQAQKAAKAHRKATASWLRQLQMEREEEATRKLLQNKKWLYVAQSGRKSSVRASARATPEPPSSPGPGASSSGGSGYGMSMSGRRRMMSSSGSGGTGGTGGSMDDDYEEEEDEDRFESTRAEVPPMLQFDQDADDHKYHDMVDNTGIVEDSRQLDQDIKILRPWHPDEEDVFVRAFLRFHKDFLKIQSYLPGKSLQEIIWFYYTRKNKLDLKRRWQREGINQLQLLNLGLSALTPSDPAAATLAHYMGSAVEWVNGTSRRGSLRLLEKGSAPKGPPPPAPSFNAASPAMPSIPTSGAAPSAGAGFPSERQSARLASTIFEDPDVDIERSLHDSGNYSPGRPSSTAGEGQNRWTAEEREKFKLAFDVHYKDFKAIADIMRTKNAAQCKNYYHNNKKKLGLPSGTLGRSTASAGSSGGAKTGVGSSTTPPPSMSGGQSSKASTGPLNASDMDVDLAGLDQPGSASASLHTSSVTILNDAAVAATTSAATATSELPSPHHPDMDFSSDALDLASPTPKRGSAARINTSHWTDEEKAKFKSLLQVHGKDWKTLAAGIPSKTVNQIKNFFQNYRTKLKLDDLLPESDRNATSSRGGRGKKRKIKPRGRPKKSGAGDGLSFGGDDDGSDYLDDSEGASGLDDEDSGYEDLKTSSELATPSGQIELEDANLNSRSASGKRRNSEALETVELDILNDSTTASTPVVGMSVDDLQTSKDDTLGGAGPAKRGGRGGGRGGRGRGRGASSAASAPPVKKRKLQVTEGDEQHEDGISTAETPAEAPAETPPETLSAPSETPSAPLAQPESVQGQITSVSSVAPSMDIDPLISTPSISAVPQQKEYDEAKTNPVSTPSITDTLNALDTLSTLSQTATPAPIAKEAQQVSSELLELKAELSSEPQSFTDDPPILAPKESTNTLPAVNPDQ